MRRLLPGASLRMAVFIAMNGPMSLLQMANAVLWQTAWPFLAFVVYYVFFSFIVFIELPWMVWRGAVRESVAAGVDHGDREENAT